MRYVRDRRLYLLLLSLISFQLSFSQIDVRRFYINPPIDFLIKGVQDLDNANFSKRYYISQDSFLVIFNLHFNEADSYTEPGNVVKGANGKLYDASVERAYFYDVLHEFRKRPGDCGWVPGYIKFSMMPGKEKEAKAFLLSNKIKIVSKKEETELFEAEAYKTTNGRYDNPVIDSFEYYFCRVPMMTEEQWVKKFQRSGFFQYASREGMPCGGGVPDVIVKRKAVFGNASPNRVSGIKFINDFFKGNLHSKVKCTLTPLQDFSYEVVLTGPSVYMSLGKPNLWEKHAISIFYQNGFGVAPDEMEIMIYVKAVDFAKGNLNAMPPALRFSEPNDLQINAMSTEVREFISNILEKMATKHSGKLK